MGQNEFPAVVSTDWLAENLGKPDICVIDASWYLPTDPRDAKAEYLEAHIPGAVFFDIDEICDLDTDLPHMLPPPEKFTARVRKLGIGDGHRIIVYDGAGIFSAPRVWWMFRVMGHKEVSVLNGGLPKWRKEGRPTIAGKEHPSARHFTARIDRTLVRDRDQVLASLDSGAEQIVDARPAPRFRGEVDEPRPGLRRGHIPGSRNVPFADVLTAEGELRPAEQIIALFESENIDLSKPIITSCGSGVTAAVLSLALDYASIKKVSLYDGSWAEWGAREDLPVENTSGVKA